MKKILFFALLILTVISCSDNKKTIKFNKNDFEGTWPFSVNSIEVYCTGYKEIYCKADNGNIYALNGSAKSASRNNPDVFDIDKIWLDNTELPGTKIPYSNFIEEGLKICEYK